MPPWMIGCFIPNSSVMRVLIDLRLSLCPLVRVTDSDRNNDPAERAPLDQVTKCVCGIFKRECLGDDVLDPSRTEKLGNGLPRVGPGRQRLGKQRETFNAG